jgi:hypothetical protein
VLLSIQGLQQRLNDFSVEEVNRAHEQAHTLIHELEGLQARLLALAKLKQTADGVHARLAAIPEFDFDLIGPDSLENHPQLHAIVKAGKLIRMHRLLRDAQVAAQAAQLAPESGVVSPVDAEKLPELTLDTEASQQESASADVGANLSSAIQPAGNPVERQWVAPISRARPIYDFAELELQETAKSPATLRDKPSPTKAGRALSPSGKGNKRTGKPHIDHRLLNDLVGAYGEFVISKQPPAGPQSITTPGVVEQMPVAVPEETSQPELNASTAAFTLVPPEAAPKDPPFVEPLERSGMLALPEPEQQREEPVFDGPPVSSKSRGEIDRQLKSIIKDYGEYDLYSDQKSFNVKNAVIAAVIGVSLLAGGFFLFKASSTPAPSGIESGAPKATGGMGVQPNSAR